MRKMFENFKLFYGYVECVFSAVFPAFMYLCLVFIAMGEQNAIILLYSLFFFPEIQLRAAA